jgi:hypothetical protein
MPGLSHQSVVPGWVAALEDGVHGIGRLPPLVLDRKRGDPQS